MRYVLTFVVLASSSFVHATSVIYEEGVFGDIEGNPIFEVQEGVNSVSGRIEVPTWPEGDEDDFRLAVGAGQTIRSITVTVLSPAASGAVGVGWFMVDDDMRTFSGATVLLQNQNTASTFNLYRTGNINVPVLGQGLWQIDTRLCGACSGLIEYEIQITVVPIPAAFWMLVSAVTGLLGFVRARRNIRH